MAAISSWLAGAFDVNGTIYPRDNGLAVRVAFPTRGLAQQVRLAMGGGKVQGIRPSHWTVWKPRELDTFINRVGPFIRGRREALQILTDWRDGVISAYQAGNLLSDAKEHE